MRQVFQYLYATLPGNLIAKRKTHRLQITKALPLKHNRVIMQKMRLTTTSLVFFMTNFHRTLHNTSNRILINLNMETKPLKGLSNMLAPSRKLYRIQSSLSECYYKFW